jgi:integrase
MAGRKGHRGWGWIRRLPSGRVHASYIGPDGIRHNAPRTFGDRMAAEVWLAKERRLIDFDEWTPSAQRQAQRQAAAVTVHEYITEWIKHRQLKPRSRTGYEDALRLYIKPKLGKVTIGALTPDAVRSWFTGLADKPTARMQAYAVLAGAMKTAAADGLIASSPVNVARASAAPTRREAVILDVKELAELAAAVPEQLKAFVLIAAWCGLRFGEVIELRRKDIDPQCEVLHVTRAAGHRRRECFIDTPKSGKGRTVVVPPHVRPALMAHLETFVEQDDSDLLFTPARDGGCHMTDWTVREGIKPALVKLGRGDMRIHDMRHFAGTMTARVGNLPETMGRLGHSSVRVSLMYQGTVTERDGEIAAALSKLAEL